MGRPLHVLPPPPWCQRDKAWAFFLCPRPSAKTLAKPSASARDKPFTWQLGRTWKDLEGPGRTWKDLEGPGRLLAYKSCTQIQVDQELKHVETYKNIRRFIHLSAGNHHVHPFSIPSSQGFKGEKCQLRTTEIHRTFTNRSRGFTTSSGAPQSRDGLRSLL